MYLIPLHCTLKSSQDGKFYITSILTHFFTSVTENSGDRAVKELLFYAIELKWI